MMITRPYSASPSDTTNTTSHPLSYFQESLVVLIRLKSNLLGPLPLRKFGDT
ncbi:hypothetical protein A2U01_0112634, partial [Trifolium medium]|nr:hypothetical protein [Trifolium medium]